MSFDPSLGRADLDQELVNGRTQHSRLVVEFARIGQHIRSGLARGCRRRGDAADMGADLARSGRNRLDVASGAISEGRSSHKLLSEFGILRKRYWGQPIIRSAKYEGPLNSGRH